MSWLLIPSQGSVSPVTNSEHDEVWHMFLLAGQSNMAGRGSISDRSPSTVAPPDKRIGVLGEDGAWKVPAQHPLHYDKPDVAGVGPGLEFARAIVDFLPVGEQRLGLIPAAFGGSEIARWMEDGDLFQAAVKQVRRGRAAGGVLSGILWHQGESDCANETDALAYEHRLRGVISSFRHELVDPNVPMILGELGIQFLDLADPLLTYAKLVNQAIVKTGSDATVVNVAVASSAGLEHNSDHLHFSAAAADVLGRRYAWKWLKLTGRLNVSLRTLIGNSLEPPLADLSRRLDTRPEQQVRISLLGAVHGHEGVLQHQPNKTL